jgi:hypothetical protein
MNPRNMASKGLPSMNKLSINQIQSSEQAVANSGYENASVENHVDDRVHSLMSVGPSRKTSVEKIDEVATDLAGTQLMLDHAVMNSS